MSDKNIVRVAVPVPLRRCFDYRLPEGVNADAVQPGMRLWVSFGRKYVMGIIDEVGVEASIELSKIKSAINVPDSKPLINKALLWLCRWASQYYHYPLGEVYHSALPVYFRKDNVVERKKTFVWQLTDDGQQLDKLPKSATRQAMLLQCLRESPSGLTDEQLRMTQGQCKTSLISMEKKGWVARQPVSHVLDETVLESPLKLNQEQQSAVEKICSHQDAFAAFLLYGE